MSRSEFSEHLKTYLDKRVLTVFALGISSGFPWVIIGSSLTLWLKENDLSRTTIGYFGAVFAAYSLNWLWSPLVDRIHLRFLGQRRGWIFLGQMGIAACAYYISRQSPADSLEVIAWAAVALAFFAATHDIAIDAFRIDSFADHEKKALTAASAMTTSGWWTGYAGLGFFPLWLSDNPNWTWPDIYVLMTVMVVAISLVTILAKEPVTNRDAMQESAENNYLHKVASASKAQNMGIIFTLFGLVATVALLFADLLGHSAFVLLGLLLVALAVQLVRVAQQEASASQSLQVQPIHKVTSWLIVTLVEPFLEFFRRNGVKLAAAILAFIFLFKIGEAFLGRMSVVFYAEIGFSNTDIATYSKLLSWWVTILFSVVGGIFNMHFGIVRGLMIGGIAMAASNLLFSAMSIIGPNIPFYAFTVIVDGFCQAWSTVAFVAFLSMLSNKAFTASQYALMASLGTFSRTLLSSYSGALVDWLEGDWFIFFAITALMVIPSLILLWSIRKPLDRISETVQVRP
nr:MFS transporter permease [Microbulbifer sp. NKW57]